MKNRHLLALILALSPFSVHAQELSYEASGSLNGFYGYSEPSERYKKQNDNNTFTGAAEINLSALYEFNADTSAGLYLDLSHGFNKNNRTYNNGSWGKEIYSIIDSTYGRLMLGETYNTAYQFHQGIENLAPIDLTDFIINPNNILTRNQTSHKTLNSTKINTDGVAPKISYITPEFYGSMLGFSYIDDINNRRGLAKNELHYNKKDGYVASFYNNIDTKLADIYTSVSYAEFRDKDKEYSASIRLERGNWSLGGSYRKAYIDGTKNQISPSLADNYREGHAWDTGIGYKIGPYKMSLTYFNSKADNTDNEDEIIMLSNRYQYNKWLDVYLAFAHENYRGEDKSLDNNNKGYSFITGLGLNF